MMMTMISTREKVRYLIKY